MKILRRRHPSEEEGEEGGDSRRRRKVVRQVRRSKFGEKPREQRKYLIARVMKK